jgi:zinc protease
MAAKYYSTMRRLLFPLVALVTIAPGPLVAQGPPQPVRLAVPYTEFTLENGLHVILHRDTSVPTVAVNVWYHVGSGSEKPGRTGFAHLFEHLMFEGSKNVPEGAFDSWLEAAGGNNNGSTNTDRTNYFIDIPSSALELALFVESDRMGYLLDTMTPERVDGQRDVVKNERRQSYENQPYGRAFLSLFELLYPKNHPYSWPTIGSMEDLTAASRDDVADFFKTYYAPNNASLVIAGDIDVAQTRKLVEKWFSEIPRGPAVPPITTPAAALTSVKKHTMTDRVQLPRLYLAWHTPAVFQPGDAAMDIAASLLTGGKNARLYRRLVYDLQMAQDVSAFQQSQALGSVFLIVATARPGHTLDEIQTVIDEELEKLRAAPAEAREMARTLNQIEATFYRGMERVGGFGGKADQLNAYFTRTGMPDYFDEDLSRYRALTAEDIKSAVNRYLPRGARVELSVVPEGKQ